MLTVFVLRWLGLVLAFMPIIAINLMHFTPSRFPIADCAPDDMINGKEIGSCLGDLYSVVWMENSDAEG